MKQLIKRIVPEKFHWIFKKYYKRSYSQSGEDMIIDTILHGVKKGFYVDVGANNPIIQSNTHFFYEKGWNGINIDARPGSMKQFNCTRLRDINLEIPISECSKTLKYFMFSSSYYNTFVEEYANELIDNHGKDFLVGIQELQTKKLSWIFDKYLNNKMIDFLTVDVEGLELQVLKSNNWNKYRPKIVIFETHSTSIESLKASEINQFLNNRRYTFYCFSPTNVFFIENEFYNVRFCFKTV